MPIASYVYPLLTGTAKGEEMEIRKESVQREVDLEEPATNFLTNASAAAPSGAASSELSRRLALLTLAPGRLTARRRSVR
jgi:hypothetical protein